MKRVNAILLLICFIVWPIRTFAQSLPQDKEDHGGTYLKFGISNWEGEISGFKYRLNGLNAEIETYFGKNHLQLSGWSFGYRKDDLRYSDSGHMLNFKVFRSFNLKVVEVKTGMGVDWGMPSLNFDKTKFDYPDNNRILYEHVFPIRNSNIPHVGQTKDGILYPFADFSILKRTGPFLFETGARGNIMKFGIDNYDITDDSIKNGFRNRTIIIPSLYINLGIKLY